MNWAKEIRRGVAKRLAANYVGFWGAYWVWVAVFILGLLCDMGSTMWFMVEDGVEMELHFFVRLAGRMFGPVAGPVLGFFGKLGAGLLVGVYCRRYAAWIFGAGAAISFWAAWYNLWGG